MAFIFSKNIGNFTAAGSLYALKELLKTAGWTVPSSSDGTTYNSTGDQITSSSTGTGGLNNSNAWIRIRMPTANNVNREFLFQRSSDSAFTARYSYSAGFVGGSPSATVLPTATDSVTLSNFVINSLANTQRAQIGADNEAPYGFYIINYSTVSSGSSSAEGGGMLFEPIQSGTGPPLDPDPYVIYMAPAGNSFENNLNDDTATSSSTAGGRCWFGKGTAGEVFTGIAACSLVASTTMFPGAGGVNPYSLQMETAPMLWARVGDTVTIGIKGFGSIMKWNGVSRGAGDTLSISTTRDRICYHDTNFPWDGTVPQR